MIGGVEAHQSREKAPVCLGQRVPDQVAPAREALLERVQPREDLDRKSTRLNSSHSQISYAVFCLKKKKSSERRSRRCWTTMTGKCRVRTTSSAARLTACCSSSYHQKYCPRISAYLQTVAKCAACTTSR